jgi:hypothetical protein
METRAEIEERLLLVKLAIDQVWSILQNPYLSRRRRAELEVELVSCERVRTELFSAMATLGEETVGSLDFNER